MAAQIKKEKNRNHGGNEDNLLITPEEAMNVIIKLQDKMVK